MKNLCINRRGLSLQKALEKLTCLFSETSLKAVYQLSVQHIIFVVQSLSPVTNKKWLDNLSLPGRCKKQPWATNEVLANPQIWQL